MLRFRVPKDSELGREMQQATNEGKIIFAEGFDFWISGEPPCWVQRKDPAFAWGDEST